RCTGSGPCRGSAALPSRALNRRSPRPSRGWRPRTCLGRGFGLGLRLRRALRSRSWSTRCEPGREPPAPLYRRRRRAREAFPQTAPRREARDVRAEPRRDPYPFKPAARVGVARRSPFAGGESLARFRYEDEVEEATTARRVLV